MNTQIAYIVLGLCLAGGAWAQGDLRAHYPLDGTGVDVSGNGNDCSVSGAQPSFDRFGNPTGALSFDGQDDYCQKNSPTGLDPVSSNWSVSAWVGTFVPTGQLQTIVGRYDCGVGTCSGGDDAALWRLGINGDGKAFFEIRGDNLAYRAVTSGSVIADGAWHRVAGVVDRDEGEMRLYVDEVSDGPPASLAGVASIFDGASPLSIGRWFANNHLGPSTNYFAGEIDEVLVFASTHCGLTDGDGDCIGPAMDNCTLEKNLEQVDTNGDGIGNICDADLNNDCLVNFGDLAALKAAFVPNYNPDADFDGDGFVNFSDLVFMKSSFFNGASPGPGPSGIPNDCDGS